MMRILTRWNKGNGGVENLPVMEHIHGKVISFKSYQLIAVLMILSAGGLMSRLIRQTLPYLPDMIVLAVDATVMTFIVLPLLYIFVIRPFVRDRVTFEERMKEGESKYRSLVESTEDSIYLVDKQFRYLFINDNHLKRMGITKYEYWGRTYGQYHSKEENDAFIENVNAVFSSGMSLKHEHMSKRDNLYFLQTLSPVKNARGEIVAVTIVSKDITPLKLLESELHSLSISDELTGLYNRRGFFHLAEHHLKLARRQHKNLVLLYADLDNLKEINDTFGHSEGDRIIADAARILKKTYRESDIIARIGGDEFAVFPAGTSSHHVETIIRRLEINVEEHNRKEERPYTLSMSVGVALYDSGTSMTAEELLSEADKSMYKQKNLKKQSESASC